MIYVALICFGLLGWPVNARFDNQVAPLVIGQGTLTNKITLPDQDAATRDPETDKLILQGMRLIRHQQLKPGIVLLLQAKQSASEIQRGGIDLTLADAYFHDRQYENALPFFRDIVYTPSKTLLKIETEDGTVTYHQPTPEELQSGYRFNENEHTMAKASMVPDGKTVLSGCAPVMLFEFIACLAETRRWDEARQVYVEAVPRLNSTEDDPAYGVRQSVDFAGQDFVEARFLSAVYASLGMVAYKDADYDTTKAYLLHSLKLYSRNVCANYYLGRMLQLHHEDEAATPYLEVAKKYGGKMVADALKADSFL